MAENDPRSLARVKALYGKVHQLPPEQQLAAIELECAGDQVVKAQVVRLLKAKANAPKNLMPVSNDESSRLGPGRIVGRYRILSELGEGGMGVVYKAMMEGLAYPRAVALKVVKPERLQAEHLLRFRQEREIVAAIDHPNVAKFLDMGLTSNGSPFFVMELVDGQPIDRFCFNRGLSVWQRLELFQQVCEAVTYLHDHRILHRDLTPKNILVSQWSQAKVVDFGIAKPFGAAGEGTEGSGWVMTPNYASPEQKAQRELTPASDLYSLGVVLHELLVGLLPQFSVRRGLRFWSPGRKLAKPSTRVDVKKTAMAMSVQQARSELAAGVDAVLALALQEDPAMRYPSVDLLRIDLSRIVAGLPIHVHIASRRSPLG